jgi:glycosyltransferase involved in cell wall biosynthesis
MPRRGGAEERDMRILALEPYYGGSHKAFLDGWSALSRHTWDLLFCSDMLNLAEFRGLVPRGDGDLPTLVYFHENQLTYPVRVENERDYQFAMTNMTSALAADAVWFNSAFHRDEFLDALDAFLRRMPDHQPAGATETIRRKAQVYPPGVATMRRREGRKPGAPRILWAARWEHDKNPEDFFKALAMLRRRGIEFRISVIGEQFRETPQILERARYDFADCIDRWGYQESRAEYEAALLEADVFVSTARHEFFGLCAVEAALAGAVPLLPDRLAYPEIFGLDETEDGARLFYDGSPEALTEKLAELTRLMSQGQSLAESAKGLRNRLERFEWSNLVGVLDEAAEKITTDSSGLDLR